MANTFFFGINMEANAWYKNLNHVIRQINKVEIFLRKEKDINFTSFPMTRACKPGHKLLYFYVKTDLTQHELMAKIISRFLIPTLNKNYQPLFINGYSLTGDLGYLSSFDPETNIDPDDYEIIDTVSLPQAINSGHLAKAVPFNCNQNPLPLTVTVPKNHLPNAANININNIITQVTFADDTEEEKPERLPSPVKKCTCGAHKVHGEKCDQRAHSVWCDLVYNKR
jgi:hypothetical protein